jgi:hypothetical protein
MALPALEIMSNTAHAGAGIPKRYFVGFAGTSTGFPTFEYDLLKPDALGTGYDVKRALAPLTDLGVRDEVSVVTDLEIPWGEDGSIPAGGRHIGWHAHSTAPLISGVRSIDGGNEAANGATSEVIAADALGGDTLHHYLNYRVQAAYYRGSNGDGGNRGRITYRDDGGTIVPIDPIQSPRLAYESLFTGFVPPDPAEAAAALAALRRRRSAVDLVLEDAQSLMTRLGTGTAAAWSGTSTSFATSSAASTKCRPRPRARAPCCPIRAKTRRSAARWRTATPMGTPRAGPTRTKSFAPRCSPTSWRWPSPAT